MKVIKKNQIIILIIALLLVSVGYLSYTGGESNEIIKTTSGEIVDETEVAGIGDAKLVSSNSTQEIEQVAMVPNEEIENMDNIENSSETGASVKNLEYFSSSRLNRETMYSQMIESYQKILESDKISEEQKKVAQAEIQNINNIKNKIMICENLIKIKGIEDLIIFLNDKSVNVIVRADSLEQDQIAQIQNIIQREMNAEISDIHISNK